MGIRGSFIFIMKSSHNIYNIVLIFVYNYMTNIKDGEV